MSTLAAQLFGDQASTAGAPAQTADQSQHQAPQGTDPAQQIDPAQQHVTPPDQIRIPKERFDEVNQARREAVEYARQMEAQAHQLAGYIRAIEQQRMAAASPPQQAPEEPPLPDMINDPQGYAKAVADQAERRADQKVAEVRAVARQVAWANDEMRAAKRFGDDTVEAAKHWVRQNGLDTELSKRPNPFTAAVELYRTAQLRNAVPNGDLNQFRTQVLRDALSNPEFVKQIAPMLLQARPGVAPQPAVIPPPLSGQPRHNASQPETMFASGLEGVKAMLAARRSA